MNRILLILVFIFSFVFSFGQPIVPRSNGSLTVQDSNWFAGNSMRVPLFFDTAHANTNRPSLDSMGKIIFTRDINWFWGRVYIPGTSSHKWVPFANPSTNINVNCGNSIGGHIVTRDSALTFDVTGGPYVLCCDGIPRATNFTTVTLSQGDSLNPRWDAIILDSNGVHVIQGTPDPNPQFPQISSCQILLTYVNVLTGQMVPANITQTIIYDQFVQGEWDSLRTSLVTVNPLDPDFPIHLTVAAHVFNYSNGTNFFEFHTDTAVDLNNFSALKFYIRDSSAVRVSITWYLDGQPQTPAALAPIQTFIINAYQTIVMPISNWRFTNNSTLANTIRFTITPINAGDAKGLYIDWIQLQGGILITNTSTTGLQSFSATGIDAVGTTVNNPNGPNTQLVLTKPNQPPWTVYGNPFGFNAPFIPTAVDLSTPMITGLLDPIHILPSTTEGDILFTENNGGNLITAWGGAGQDTTFVINWLRRFTDPNSFNDSIGFGSPFRDSAVIKYSIFTGLNHFTWTMTDTTNDLIQFNSSGIKSFNGVFPTSGSGGTDSAIFRNSSTGQWYLAPSGSGGVTADNGLTMSTPSNVQLGGTLLKNTTVDVTGAFTLTVQGSSPGGFTFKAINSSNGIGSYGETATGFGMIGLATGTGIGVQAWSTDGVPLQAVADGTDSTTVIPMIQIERQTFGTPQNGIGGSIEFITQGTGGTRLSNQIISRWLNATDSSRSSELDVTGVYNAVTDTLEKLNRQASTYTSGTHTFNTDTLFHVFDGNNDLLYIDPISFLSLLQANNGTAVTEIRVFADLANTLVGFNLAADNGSGGTASINGDAIARTLLFTTNESIFHSGIEFNYTSQTGTYGILPTDYTIDCTANSFTVTLPTAVGIVGQFYFITNSGAGTITVATTSAQTFVNIGGTPTSITLNTKTGILVQSNGANWLKVSGF